MVRGVFMHLHKSAIKKLEPLFSVFELLFKLFSCQGSHAG